MRDRQARLATFGAFAIQGLCFASLVTRVPQIQDAHGLSDADLAIVLLLVPVIAGVGSALSGLLFARYGSAVVLRVAQPAVCVASVLIGLTGGELLPLYGAVALFGLFVGAVDASMNAQAVAVERHEGRSVISGFYAVWSVAGIAGGLWASFANSRDLSLFEGFVIPSALGIAGALFLGRYLYKRAEEAGGPSAEEIKAAAKRVPWRPILLVGVAMGSFYIADAAISNYSAKFLEDELDASSTVAPLAYVAYQVAMVLSRSIADFGVRRFGPVLVVRAGAVVGFLGMLGVILSPSALVAIAAVTVMGLGVCVVAPIAFSAADRVDGTGLGIAVSRVNLFNYVGFVLGAAIIGAFAPADGASNLRLAFTIPAGLILLIVLLAPSFAPKPTAGAAEPAAA
ncbi:MFS transporter [Actinocorallia sp. A-T 12471]|uniref:MFS transporter n=1 Tax=Actinocorallia sp. A-T 12471 TaxID=3089813 RepID=UPI0029D2F19E|nr:MFS transporter [Actinocorallia sp. A-T 12471]MDX6738592.1 MFS transporter [Actinocorallia sp. A-T 12471]